MMPNRPPDFVFPGARVWIGNPEAAEQAIKRGVIKAYQLWLKGELLVSQKTDIKPENQ